MAIELISKIKPKNSGNFPIADAVDISVDNNNRRLSTVLPIVFGSGVMAQPILIKQEDYDALKQAGTLDETALWLIYEDDEE